MRSRLVQERHTVPLQVRGGRYFIPFQLDESPAVRIFGVRLRSGHLNLYLPNQPSILRHLSSFFSFLPLLFHLLSLYSSLLSTLSDRLLPGSVPFTKLPEASLLSSSLLSIELWHVYGTWQLRMFQKRRDRRNRSKEESLLMLRSDRASFCPRDRRT